MNGVMNYIKPKLKVSLLAFLMAAFFLVPPISAQGYYTNFWADRTQIYPGECITIYWDTDNVQTVYYNNQPVSGITQTRVECPTHNTTYNLLVTTRDGQKINKQIYVQVSNPPQPGTTGITL